MGKTKTAFIEGVKDEALTSEEKYRLKQEKRAAEEAKSGAVSNVTKKGNSRIKVVEGVAEVTVVEEVKPEEPVKAVKTTVARVRGKKYLAVKSKVDRTKHYSLSDAIALVKETNISKFAGTVELTMTVRKDTVNVNVSLPHSFGKGKVIEVANDETIEKLKKGKVDFDVLLATADMMPKLVMFAKILGPKGLMPNPKNGTVIKSASDAKSFSADTLSVKTEKKAPVIHTIAGKTDMSDKDLEENVNAILEAINRRIVLKAYLKATMSPSVRLVI